MYGSIFHAFLFDLNQCFWFLGKRLGDCWAFPGDKGHLTIKLAVPIVVSSVSLEHMPGESDSDEISSAPKDFSVDGWSTNPLVESLNTPLRLIEGAEYNITSSTVGYASSDILCFREPAITIFILTYLPTYGHLYVQPAQNFQVEDGQQLNEHVQYVTLNVESNHGNSDCTCIYRFRVHGSQASGTYVSKHSTFSFTSFLPSPSCTKYRKYK